MKAIDIMNDLFALESGGDYANTCDTCKAGDPNAEVTRVAVAMFGTPQVIKDARDWGAELLIVHEPLYYNHFDEHSSEALEAEKRALIEQSGLTIFRYHDHPHYTLPDIISAGELKALGIKGRLENTDIFGFVRFFPDEPITPLTLAKRIEETLGVKHVRLCGMRDVPCTKILCMFGSPMGILEAMQSEENEIVIVGEVCEWQVGEYVRDAAQLGHKKSLLIMGHVGSERDGMAYTAELLEEMHPELTVKYFDCGEVYTYTDSNV